jgi:hypothetical protein
MIVAFGQGSPPDVSIWIRPPQVKDFASVSFRIRHTLGGFMKPDWRNRAA